MDSSDIAGCRFVSPEVLASSELKGKGIVKLAKALERCLSRQ